MKRNIYFYKTHGGWQSFSLKDEEGKQWRSFCNRLALTRTNDPDPYYRDYLDFLNEIHPGINSNIEIVEISDEFLDWLKEHYLEPEEELKRLIISALIEHVTSIEYLEEALKKVIGNDRGRYSLRSHLNKLTELADRGAKAEIAGELLRKYLIISYKAESQTF